VTDPFNAGSGAPDRKQVPSGPGSRRTLTWLVLGSLFFGGVLAVVKGQGGAGLTQLDGLRTYVGNISAPWLVLPLLAGSLTPRFLRAAALGLLSTMIALVAFYGVTAATITVDGHGFLGSWVTWASAGRGYVEGGLLSGPLLGALGAWWARRPRPGGLLLPAGVLLIGEPLVLLTMGALFDGAPEPGRLPTVLRLLPGFGIGPETDGVRLLVYVVEAVFGLAVLVVGLRLWRHETHDRQAA